MVKFKSLWKNRNYNAIYQELKKSNYEYTLDNFDKDFSKIDSSNKFCFLIYLLSNDFCVNNVLLLLDFLTYTDTFFYDIHPVIRMISDLALSKFPSEARILNWIICTYEGHPDSPFTEQEICLYKSLLS
ncbi:MAG: hypothetical protein MJ083_02020 [Clostridia bacterium]|nr:hypothetical protein [Clostridia bacterium]